MNTLTLPTMKAPSENTSEREIVISRVFHAPRELVWQAWTDPKHVVNWWGPRGFTTTTKQHDFRVGGYWEHVMHGPDGVDYPNKSKFLEIVPLDHITYLHGGGREDGPGASFTATWSFESVDDNKTRLTGRLVFPTKEARDFVVKEFGAIEGGKQTLERLAEYVPAMRAAPFTISREFKASSELMWKVWTDPKHLAVWFSPKGSSIRVATMDLRPRGMQHYCMTTADGKEMWGKVIYREIVPTTKLVWLQSFSDAAGGTTAHPMAPTWPKEMYSRADFVERDGRTTVTISWLPFDATEAEWAIFEASRAGMHGGWTGTFDLLESYIAGLPA